MKHVHTGLVIVIVIAAAAAGYGVYTWMRPLHRPVASNVIAQSSTPPPAAATLSPSQALMVSMDDLEGQPRTLDEWRGKVLFVNFWATWCPPCREEVPLLVKLQAKYAAQGLQVVGIATDEQNEQDVRSFVKKMVVNYPILMSDNQSAEIVNALGGNFIGLPVSVVLNRNGTVYKIHAGEIEPDDADDLIRAALNLPPVSHPTPAVTKTTVD